MCRLLSRMPLGPACVIAVKTATARMRKVQTGDQYKNARMISPDIGFGSGEINTPVDLLAKRKT